MVALDLVGGEVGDSPVGCGIFHLGDLLCEIVVEGDSADGNFEVEAVIDVWAEDVGEL